jgi:hypothetical protein
VSVVGAVSWLLLTESLQRMCDEKARRDNVVAM